MPFCPVDSGSGLIARLLGVVDCHIRTLAQASYANLVGPGTMFATVLTVLLTIYIALIGYQLLIGRGGLRLAQMPVEALKIGLILAFTTSWATYQTLVYDLFFEGPRQIAGVLLATAGPRAGTDPFVGLQGAYERMITAAAAFGEMGGTGGNILQGGPMLGSGMLWISAIALLMCTVGLILAAKVVLGLLLALGPLFVGLFLFDATRGFFDGWLRAVVATALTPLAASVLGAAFVLMLTPFLDVLTKLAEQRRFDMGAVITVSLIVAVFVLVMTQVLRVSTMIVSGFRTLAPKGHARDTSATRSETSTATARAHAAEEQRAAVIGLDAIAQGGLDRRTAATAEAVTTAYAPSERLNQSYRRLPRPTRRSDTP